ncbi:hypothetical protein D3C87_1563170 [compost metagenome]
MFHAIFPGRGMPDALFAGFVVNAPVFLDAREVVPDPEIQGLKRRQYAGPQFGQLVFDARRHLGKIVSPDETVAFQAA